MHYLIYYSMVLLVMLVFLERMDFDAKVICLLIQKLLVVYLMQLKFDLDIVHVVGVV